MILTEPDDFLDLEELKSYMRKGTTSDDGLLAEFLGTAQRMVVDRVGQVSSVDAREDVTGRCSVIVLRHRPVLEITGVQVLPGLAAVDEADETTGVQGWYLDGTEGVLRHTGRFPNRVRVLYKCGRNPVPDNIKQAGMELASHLWRNSQLNPAGGRPGLNQSDDYPGHTPGAAYALPIRVRELLGLGKGLTDEPLVG